MPTPDIQYLEVSPKILYFGTPVALLTSINPDGSTNAAAMSSAWALGWNLMLGLGAEGATARNLAAHPELVVNLPGPALMRQTDELGYLTARNPVPAGKRAYVRHDPDKIATAGLVTLPSVSVKPPRIDGCLLQLEGVVHSIRQIGPAEDELLGVEVRVLTVHAAAQIVVPGTDHIDPAAWKPLIYNFRHYYTLGDELGYTRRSETALLTNSATTPERAAPATVAAGEPPL
jgi:flavin reductase (DIM6/NTAB) family NADH-FMN oxidoreductase RutF